MPRIIVTTDDRSGRVLHSERVTAPDFDTEHFRAQLAERVAWAVTDAASAEVKVPEPAAEPAAATSAPVHAA